MIYKIPNYNGDRYIHITKVSNSNSDDGEWNTNIARIDYLLGFGEYEEEIANEDEDESIKSNDINRINNII